jgi:hypothetical protein
MSDATASSMMTMMKLNDKAFYDLETLELQVPVINVPNDRLPDTNLAKKKIATVQEGNRHRTV